MQITSEILAQLINSKSWSGKQCGSLEYQLPALNKCVKLTVISFHFKLNGNISNWWWEWQELYRFIEKASFQKIKCTNTNIVTPPESNMKVKLKLKVCKVNLLSFWLLRWLTYFQSRESQWAALKHIWKRWGNHWIMRAGESFSIMFY